MEELVHCHRREGDCPEVEHLVAHRVGVERHARRILHPSVGDQDPECGEGGTDDGQPSGGQVEAFAHLLPTEEHDGDEGRFHEEGHDALDGQGRSEDVAYEPTVVRPVGAKLELQDQAGSDTDREVHAEKFHPELGGLLPGLVARPVIDCFHNGLDHAQAQCQWHEEPMIHGRESELRPRPINE